MSGPVGVGMRIAQFVRVTRHVEGTPALRFANERNRTTSATGPIGYAIVPNAMAITTMFAEKAQERLQHLIPHPSMNGAYIIAVYR